MATKQVNDWGGYATYTYTVSSSATSVAITITKIQIHAGSYEVTWKKIGSIDDRLRIRLFGTQVDINIGTIAKGSTKTIWTGSVKYTYTKGTSSSTKTIAQLRTTGAGITLNNYEWDNYTVPALAKYTITFAPNGGTGSNQTVSQYYGKTITLKSNTTFSRTGYTLSGWGTSTTTKSYNCGASYTVTAAKTLYAIWTINSYTLTYNGNGGTTPAAIKRNYGATYGTLPTSTRTGYSLVGWFTAASGGSQVTSATKMDAANTTIYAHWNINNYTLNYNVNADDGFVYPTSTTVTYDTAYGILPTPIRTGYNFDGWYTAASGGTLVTGSTKMGAANTTIYAHWTEITAILTYDNNDHGTAPDPSEMSYTTETLAAAALTESGWVFQGWQRSDNQEIIQPGDVVNAVDETPFDLTLTAQWVPAIYQITLNEQDATTHGHPLQFWGSYGNGFYDNAECTGETITSITPPSKDHYSFGGYYLDSIQCIAANGTIVADSTDFTGDTTFLAQWIPDVYTIALDNQQATISGTTIYYEKYGVGNYWDEDCTELVDSIILPYKTGYSFRGYYDTTQGNTQYIDEVGEIQQKNIEESRTIYAQWSINSYQLVFNGNGGSTPESRTVVFGQPYGSNTNPLPSSERVGYTFRGWYTDATSGVAVKESTIMNTEGATVYAHWEGKEYTIGDYTYTTIATGEVAARVSEKTHSQYSPIPYSITNEDDTLIVTSLEECFKECTDLSGNIYMNCSAINNINGIFDNMNNNVCIIFGNNFENFSEVWDIIDETYENVTYLGAEDTDYYFTLGNETNRTLNVRVKDKTKQMYSLPILNFEDAENHNWEAASMDRCYQDCINLQGILQVEINPSSFDQIFDGIEHEVLLFCMTDDEDTVNKWKYIASLDDEGE